MNTHTSNIDLAGAAEKILAAKRVGVTTHAKPDGDAFGAVVALAAALRELGKQVEAWFVPPVPANFSALRGSGLVRVYRPGVVPEDLDLLVLLDTAADAQMAPMQGELARLLPRTLIVDHHLTGDLAAAWRCIDERAPACCQMVASLIEKLSARAGGADGRLFTPTVCEALFVGIASDTGWFRFSNTQPQTHELAAELMRRGVDPTELYRKLEQTERPQKLALQARALQSLRLLADGQLAVMVLRASDFAETGSRLEETERLVDLPQAVSSVRVTVLIVEPLPGEQNGQKLSDQSAIRVSFRSKPGPGAVNVAELAQQLGGGGHACAAGVKITGSLEQVVGEVISAATAATLARADRCLS